MLVGALEVVISNPECQIAVGVVKAVCRAIRSLIGAVNLFDHLVERAVFFGDGIVVGKLDDMGDFKCKEFAELFGKLHGGEGIGAAAVSDELEFIKELSKSPEDYAKGFYTMAVRYLIADDGVCGVH